MQLTAHEVERLTGFKLTDLTDYKKHATVVLYDPTLAKVASNFVAPGKQRKKRPQHIETLRRLMLSGEFDSTGDSIVFGILDNGDGTFDMQLDNGQHRMDALSRVVTTGKFETDFIVTTRMFRASDEGQRKEWFTKHDRGKLRSATDQSRIMGIDKTIEQATEKSWLDTMLTAVRWTGGNLERPANDIPAGKMSNLVTAYAPAMKTYHDLVAYTPPAKKRGQNHPNDVERQIRWSAKMRASGIAAVFLVLLKNSPADGRSIIEDMKGIARGVAGRKPKAGTQELYQFIIDAQHGAGAARIENVRTTVEMIAKIRGKTIDYTVDPPLMHSLK